MSCFSFVKEAGRCLTIGGVLMAALSVREVKADDAAFGVPLSPNAHLYSYFIINGMARGAFLMGRLHQKDMPALIQMDEQTRKVMIHNLDSQTIRSDFKADQILTRYLSLIQK